MVVALVSICSTLIIFMTIFNLVRLFRIAYKKGEINTSKFKVLATSSIVVGLIISISLYFGYKRFWDFLSNY
jgi:hypothetical protein